MPLQPRDGTRSGLNRTGFSGLSLLFVILMCILESCAVGRRGYDPESRIPPKALQEDFRIFRGVLEESHPSLYWFSPKDSIDHYFNQVAASLGDSLTERQFRTRLNFFLSKIRCGHTLSTYSKRYSRYLDTARLPVFPLSMKVWKDTLVVYANLQRKDSLLRRGTIIKAINGIPAPRIIDTFFNYINGDGYSDQGRYQFLSNTGNFGTLYKNIFGLSNDFRIEYIDPSGLTRFTTIPVFIPRPDTVRAVKGKVPAEQTGRRAERYLEIDTSLRSAYMTVNTFSRGNGLPRFFRRSFRAMKNNRIEYLVLDVRANGGGDAGNSTMLTRYITDHPFKIADSLYAIRRSSRYSGYIKWQPMYWLMMTMVTHKARDGKYHFGFFERHTFHPKRKNHFDGKVFIITGGNSFSATTLFAQKVRGQKNVTIIGEETGGGAYGNTAWMMPEVKLPNSGIRFRLPKFRLVMDPSLVHDGRGVMPDIPASPTVTDIRRGIDVKSETARQLIMHDRKSKK